MAKHPPLSLNTADKIRAARNALRMNQLEFWSLVGVTQSGGSRYEAGRKVPSSTAMLLQIAYGPQDEAAALVEFLRSR